MYDVWRIARRPVALRISPNFMRSFCLKTKELQMNSFKKGAPQSCKGPKNNVIQY